MKKKLWIMALLLTFTYSLCACVVSKPNDTQIQEALNYFLESADNPLRESYLTSEYKMDTVDVHDGFATAQILVTLESAKTHYEVTILARYQAVKGKWSLQSCRVQDDAVFYPLQAPKGDAYKALNRVIDNRFDGHTNYEVSAKDWETGKNQFTAQFTVSTEYDTYINTVQGECEMYYSCYEEAWNLRRDSYKETLDEVDFAPLNGTWGGKYNQSRANAALTDYKIPFTFTFSNAGKIQIIDGTRTTTTVMVDHTLNQLWEEYINPEFTDENLPDWGNKYIKGVRYESGTMDIEYVRSGGYYLIEFDYVLVEKDRHVPCELRIYADRIYYHEVMSTVSQLTRE